MIPYINFHTHKQDLLDSEAIQVINLFPNNLSDHPFCCVGIHPWYIKEDKIQSEIKEIRDKIQKENILFIGECGLDKVCNTDFELQKKVFRAQIEIAEEYDVPIIIHCVKAYNELFEIKRKSSSSVDWIIHGFRGSEELTRQMLDEGFYFSVCPTEKWMVKQIIGLITIPINKLFLETDESDYSIKDIYQNYSKLTGTPIEQLKEQLVNNFNKLLNE